MRPAAELGHEPGFSLQQCVAADRLRRDLQDREPKIIRRRRISGDEFPQFCVSTVAGLCVVLPALPDAAISARTPHVLLTRALCQNEIDAADRL